MPRVLLVDPIASEGEALLARHVDVVRPSHADPDTIRRLAAGVQGMVIRSKLPDDIFAVAPGVRAVAIHGTGTDLVPLEAATANGVMVSNLPGGNAQSVAEYCAMAMLMLARLAPMERLASFLLRLRRRYRENGIADDAIALPMGRGDIADHLGLTVETVSRSFTRLRNQGLVALPDPQHVKILDDDGLAELAHALR